LIPYLPIFCSDSIKSDSKHNLLFLFLFLILFDYPTEKKSRKQNQTRTSLFKFLERLRYKGKPSVLADQLQASSSAIAIGLFTHSDRLLVLIHGERRRDGRSRSVVFIHEKIASFSRTSSLLLR
jgi:hypothetical protein